MTKIVIQTRNKRAKRLGLLVALRCALLGLLVVYD